MQVSIEATSGLERRLTVGVPSDVIDSEVTKRLQKAAKTVRINGFRQGKVPMKVVRQRYGAGVRQEVLGDTINRSLQEALTKQGVRPAGQPRIEPTQFAEGQDLEYIATFEVYPEIDLKTIDQVEITKPVVEVTDADVDEMIETLRKNQASWEKVDRPAQKGDRVTIDFVGTKDGEAFEGGSAEGHQLELGSGSLIPGFESGIEGMSPDEEKTLALTFPEDYHVESLKGNEVEFKVSLKAVSERKLPEVDDAFFAVFGVNEGGIEAFKRDVKDNMEREKTKIVQNRVKTQVLDALLEANPDIEVPGSLVKDEVRALRQQALSQYGQMSDKLDMESLLPDELFKERAQRRVALGLLISDLVTKEGIRIDNDRLRGFIESVAATYEDPESVVSYYFSNQELLANAQAAVLEDQVVDHLLNKAKVEEKPTSYQQLIKADQASPENE